MDIRDLKKQADLSYDVAVAKSNALEKALSRQQFAYCGHLFMANAETICLVKTLKELQQSSFYILDVNQNPAGNAQLLQNKHTKVNKYDRFSFAK